LAELTMREGMIDDPKEWTLTAEVSRKFLPEPERIHVIGAQDPTVRIVLAIPMERTMMQEAFFSFARIFQQGWAMARLPYTRNDIAREKFAQFLLNEKAPDGVTPKYTHILMLDSDHAHPEDIVMRLARWVFLYPQSVQVVGGLNFRRGEPYDPCAFIDPGDGQFHRLAQWGKGLLSVEALGSGSLLIAREVFEKIPAPWFNYAYPGGDMTPGTDMTFSAKCRAAGITLWVDGTTTSPHLGINEIGADDYHEYVTKAQGKTVLMSPEDARLIEWAKAELAEKQAALAETQAAANWRAEMESE
jgi:hypothetical protein